MPIRIRRLSVMLVLAIVLVRPASAVAAPLDVGYEDLSFVGASPAPTGEKPESKAWFNDGFWSASMWDTASGRYEIFRLDTASQTWSSTDVALDPRPDSRADALWDGTHLYVASHIFSLTAATGYPSFLYRFSYDPGTDTYTSDVGFPQIVNNYRSESLVIDKDSTGQLWATWTFNSRVYVNRTTSGDTVWGTPFLIPGSSRMKSDDIASLIHFDSDKIGVFWSDQRGSTFRFAIHDDATISDTTWQTSVTVLPGAGNADDHMNLKSLETDGSGRVFAIVKTSRTGSTDPIVVLLVRTKTPSPSWNAYTVWRVADHVTRPIVLLDTANSVIHAFSSNEGGGAVYEKTSSLASVGFSTGLGSVVMFDASASNINNVTSTKQNLNSSTGLMILASNDTTNRYWHHYASLAGGGNLAPVCNNLTLTTAQDSTGTDVAPSCVDANLDPLTYAIGTQGSKGVASVTATNQLHYTPNPGQSGSDTFTYTANDGTLSSPPATVSVTITPSGGGGSPVTVSPVADTYVRSDTPTVANGSSSTLRSRGGGTLQINSYLRFTVSGVGLTSINEKLRLYVTDPSVDAGKLYQVLDDTWSEGMLYAGQPALGPLIVDLGAIPALGYLDIDVSSYVNGNGTYSFAVVGENSDVTMFNSRETANGPLLVVTPS